MSAAAYITASELAAMRLPGWPTSKRSWNRLRVQHGWPVADRHGPRGVELWVADGLPQDVRDAIGAWREAAARPLATPAEPRRGRPRGTGWFDRRPDQAEAVLSYIASHKHSATNVRRLLATQFDDVPELQTLRRYIRDLERTRPATLLRHRDPDAWKSRYQLALGRADASVDRAHQVWELDTTKADVMTHGGRRMVLGLIDRWSRRVRLLVAPSESGQSVRRLLIDTITAWGVMPETVVTDNGSGYINASIVSALQLLGIEHAPCLPGSPERKPFVERMFAGFMHHRAPLLPGFTGKSVAEAQMLRGRAKKRTGRAEILAHLTADQLQAHLDAWVDGHYHLAIHSSTGQAPLLRCQASPVPARAAPPAHVLEQALSAWVGTRRVGKKGITWKDGVYWCAEAAIWIGRDVVVRRNEDDLGALLLFDEDSMFIGRAINFDRAGVSEQEYAILARNHQRSHDTAERKRLREIERRYPMDRAVQDMIRAEAEAAGILVTLPPRTIRDDTPQIRSFEPMMPMLPTEAELVRAEARLPVQSAAISIADKVMSADATIAAHQAGQSVDPVELERARIYAGSNEYKTEKMLIADFGGAPVTPFPNRTERTA